MTREELAKAYANGFNKEYQQIAYDAFLCGYGAKCDTVAPEGMEEAAGEYNKQVIEETKCHHNALTYAEGYEDALLLIPDAFIAGAEWQKVQDQKTIELAEDHAMLAGMNKMEQQMMEGAVEGEVVQDLQGVNRVKSFGEVPEWLHFGDKVKLIIVKEDEK